MSLTHRSADSRVRVLAVDDEPMNLELLERTLRRQYNVLLAPDPDRGLELLRQTPDIALILSDYSMPRMSGAEFLAASIDSAPYAKRVIITGYLEVDNIISSINSGQIHYVVKKPWNHRELEQALRHLVRIYQLEAENRHIVESLRHTNRELEAKEAMLTRNLDDRSRELLDTSKELERINDELLALSYKDALTDLHSHRAFQDRFGEALDRARRYHLPLSVVVADVDHFRAANNEGGHQLGDEVQRAVAELLSRPEAGVRRRESDVVARYGGGSFALLLPETGKPAAEAKAERLRAVVAEQPLADTHVTLIFGIASFPDDADEADQLLRCAQRALHRAKATRRNRVVGHEPRAESDDGVEPDEPTAEHLVAPTPGFAAGPLLPGDHGQRPFPTYREHLPDIARALDIDRALNCLFVDLSQLRRVEHEHGARRHAEVFLAAGYVLYALRGERLRHDDIVCRPDEPDAYLCYLTAARTASETPARDLEAIALRVQESLEAALAPTLDELVHDYPRVTVGYARVLDTPGTRREPLIARLIAESRESASLMRRRSALRDKAMLQDLILTERLTAAYQPIVELTTGEIIGYEALSRGPRKTPLESPKALFSIADEVGMTFELDRACVRNGLRGAVGIGPHHLLFVNLAPLSFYDPVFVETEVTGLLEAAALTPDRIVLELPERLAVHSRSGFHRALARYTAMGLSVAIDDVGTRHSDLESVVALRPRFIKVSDVLTRGAAESTVRRELLATLARIAAGVDTTVIAAGLESPDHLATALDLGIRHGQGFFLARPGPPFPRLRASVRRMVQSLATVPRAAIGAPPAEFDPEGDFRDDRDPVTDARHAATLASPRNAAHDATACAAGEAPEVDDDGDFAEITIPRTANAPFIAVAGDATPADDDEPMT